MLDTLAPIELVLILNNRCVCGAAAGHLHVSRCPHLRAFIEWVRAVVRSVERSVSNMVREGRCRVCYMPAPSDRMAAARHVLTMHREALLLMHEPPPWCSASWRRGDMVLVSERARETPLGSAIARVARRLLGAKVVSKPVLSPRLRDVVMHRDELPNAAKSGIRGGRRIVFVP